MQRQLLDKHLKHYQAGHGLPRDFYHDLDLYQAELDLIWRRGWLFAALSCEVSKPGNYVTYDVAGDSILIVRRADGSISAMHNVCRHRGSLVATDPIGQAVRFMCPYHQWTYDLDGALLTCRGMPDTLDRSALGLKPVHVRELAGLIYISLAESPLDFEAAAELMQPLARPQGFERARVAYSVDYDIPANWKIVWENNRECYHCDVNHPQYVKANFDRYDADNLSDRIAQQIETATRRSAARWAASGLTITHPHAGLAQFPDADRNLWYSANRTALADGYITESLDGWQVAPLMGDYTDPEVGTLRLRTLPNFWCHASCDHAVLTRLTPAGPRLTKARVIWLVDQSAQPAIDYALDELLPFWQLTSEQDWVICESVQRGVDSTAFTPGPLSLSKEYNVDHFTRWYVRQLADAESLSVSRRAVADLDEF